MFGFGAVRTQHGPHSLPPEQVIESGQTSVFSSLTLIILFVIIIAWALIKHFYVSDLVSAFSVS